MSIVANAARSGGLASACRFLFASIAVVFLSGFEPVLAEVDQILIQFKAPHAVTATERGQILDVLDVFTDLVQDRLDLSEVGDLKAIRSDSLSEGPGPLQVVPRDGVKFYLAGQLRPPRDGACDLIWRLYEAKGSRLDKISAGGVSLKLSAKLDELVKNADSVAGGVLQRIGTVIAKEVVLAGCFTCTLKGLIEAGVPTRLPAALKANLIELETKGYKIIAMDPTTVGIVCLRDIDRWTQWKEQADYVIGGVISRAGANDEIGVWVLIETNEGDSKPLSLTLKRREISKLEEDLAKLIQQEWENVVQQE